MTAVERRLGTRLSQDDSKDSTADAGNSNFREALERMVVRLSVIADRCADPVFRYELKQVIGELVKLIEDHTQSPRAQ